MRVYQGCNRPGAGHPAKANILNKGFGRWYIELSECKDTPCVKNMRIIIAATVILMFQLSSLTPALSDEPGQKILLTNVHVFDGLDNDRLMNANVLVDGNLIEAISTDDLVADPHENFDLIMKDGEIYKNTLK